MSTTEFVCFKDYDFYYDYELLITQNNTRRVFAPNYNCKLLKEEIVYK